MSIGAATEVTELLRSLPDMRPPEDAWKRIVATRRRGHPLAWSAVALAACAALVAIVLLAREEAPRALRDTYVVATDPQPRQVTPAESSAAVTASALAVRDLRRRSRQMERLLSGLPPRTQVVRADVAGMVTELQDRIAAVDYELNRQARGTWSPAATARWAAERSVATRSASRYSARQPRDLWQERVELMDRLVRARFAEAGAEAH